MAFSSTSDSREFLQILNSTHGFLMFSMQPLSPFHLLCRSHSISAQEELFLRNCSICKYTFMGEGELSIVLCCYIGLTSLIYTLA